MSELDLINVGCKNVQYYSLINNYGFRFTFENTKYDLRHWLNVYGASVDFWSLTGKDLKTNEYVSIKEVRTFEQAIEYFKNRKEK